VIKVITNKGKILITILVVLILCGAAFTVLYLTKPHYEVPPVGTETGTEPESESTTETTAPELPDIPPIIPKETETETLQINVLEMERDPNPHIISTEIIYGEEDE
jgi:flagellar basal body-associated protein FliL